MLSPKWYFAVLSGTAALLFIQGPARAETPAQATSWAPVEALLQKKWDADKPTALKGFGLVVYDRKDKKVYEKMLGDFSPDKVVAIASASKMISGLMLFEVTTWSKGKLTLDSTTGEILGWTGDKAKISLRHLLSFTSGMKAESPSIFNARLSLGECVEKIAEVPLVDARGKVECLVSRNPRRSSGAPQGSRVLHSSQSGARHAKPFCGGGNADLDGGLHASSRPRLSLRDLQRPHPRNQGTFRPANEGTLSRWNRSFSPGFARR